MTHAADCPSKSMLGCCCEIICTASGNCRPAMRMCLVTSKSDACAVRTLRALPFKIHAWVLLPDHLHCIWELPPGDVNVPSDFEE